MLVYTYLSFILKWGTSAKKGALKRVPHPLHVPGDKWYVKTV